MALSQDLKEFLRLLVEHEVVFMLVGAHAVAVHGYPRGTGDIAFWIRRDEANARKLLAALDAFGFGLPGLAVADLMDENAVIQLGRELHRIDLLTFLTGLDFDDCLPRALDVRYENLPLRVIGREDLLRNKRATGRLKDRMDVDEFERAEREGIKGNE